MPFTTDNFMCPACSIYHVLYCGQDEAPDYTTAISYKCPETKRDVRIPSPQFAWVSVQDKPDRSVPVR